VRDKVYPNLGTIHDLAYVIGEATLMMNASYRWHDEFAFFEFSKKKIILKRSNVKYWVTESYDEILYAQNLAGIRKVLVFEDFFRVLFWSAIHKTFMKTGCSTFITIQSLIRLSRFCWWSRFQ